MGFNFEFLAFFDACHAIAPLQSPFLSLGSQEIHETQKTIDTFCAKEKHPRLAKMRTLCSLLADRYGIDEYADLDLNDVASIKADLNCPISEELRGKWKTIYDGGTSEHVFDIAAAFKGIHDLCYPKGGIILHVAPLTWLSHGYYNLTPHLFKSIARANQYRILATGYYFRSTAISEKTGCSSLQKILNIGGLVLTELDGKKTSEYDLAEQWFSADRVPTNALFCIGYQKRADTSFASPYDIQS